MAQPDPLPGPTRRDVARQVGDLLAQAAGGVAALAVPAAPALAESLAVCFVGADQVTDPPADLARLALPTGLWHHQIRTAAGPTHVARSSRQGFGADRLDVQQVAASPAAARLEAAMNWIDRRLPDGGATARLLEIPAYFIRAILLIRGARLTAVLVEQPDGFKALKYRREYPLRDFLKRVAKERPAGTLA